MLSLRIGRIGSLFCTLCAIAFCLLTVLQSAVAGISNFLPVVLCGALASAILLFLVLRSSTPFRSALPVLFLVRFALAMVSALTLKPEPVQDFNTMYQAACQLAAGDFSYLENVYFFKWAYQSAFVAYEALVIRVFGSGLLPLQILNAVWMAATVCMVYLIAKKFFSEQVSVAVSLLYAVYPAPLMLAGVLTNQHLATFLFYLAIWLLLREDSLSWKSALLAGVCIALGNAIRGVGIILILAILLFALLLLFARQGINPAKTALKFGSVAVTYFLVMALLSVSISASGINPEGLNNNLPSWKFLVGLNMETNGSWSRSDYETFQFEPFDQAEAAMKDEVKNRLSVGPISLAKLAVRKSAVMWGDYEDFYWGFSALDSGTRIGPVSVNTLQLLLSRFDKGVYLLTYTLALLGLIHLLRSGPLEQKGLLLLVILLCGYYGVHLILEVQSRYRYFLMPAVFLLAGQGLAWFPLPRSKKTY